jgi:hypothetical protein
LHAKTNSDPIKSRWMDHLYSPNFDIGNALSQMENPQAEPPAEGKGRKKPKGK